MKLASPNGDNAMYIGVLWDKAADPTSGTDDWEPVINPDEGALCFGRVACREASRHLLLTQGKDLAGAKLIAATYCIDNMDKCVSDARSMEIASSMYYAFVGALAGGAGLAGGTRGTVTQPPPIRYGPGAQRAGEPRWPVPTASNCSQCAVKIQKIIGGEIKTIRSPGPVLGPSKHNRDGDWGYHDVVVLNGRVYDGFTGRNGLPINEFKAQFDYADVINFGF
jgi:hypothetical protein